MANYIILIIDNETPIRADALGELFTAFARDYRNITRGRTLVVVRLQEGSTFVEWSDFVFSNTGHYAKVAVDAIKAIKGLADFAENLKSLLGKKRPEQLARQAMRGRKKMPGQRSAEAIAKIAAENHCHAHVKWTSAQGERLEFELTPQEAVSFQETIRVGRDAPQALRQADFPPVSEVAPALNTSIEQLYAGALTHTHCRPLKLLGNFLQHNST